MCGSADGLSYCGARIIFFYDTVTGNQVTSSNFPFFSYNPSTYTITIQSTSKLDVAINVFEIRATLTNFPTPYHVLYANFTVTVLAECINSIL